jgi:hypothetical protein
MVATCMGHIMLNILSNHVMTTTEQNQQANNRVGNDMLRYHPGKPSRWLEGIAGFGSLLLVAAIMVLIS